MPFSKYGNVGDSWGNPDEIDFRNIRAGAINAAQLVLVGAASFIRSSNFDDATAGWQIKGDGVAKFREIFADSGELGDLTVTGTITLGTGGVFRTATSGLRIEMTATDNDRITFFTADSFEATGGTLRPAVVGTDGTTRQLLVRLGASVTTGDSNSTFLDLRSESENDSSIPPQMFVGYGGGSSQIPQLKLINSFRLMLEDGTSSLPSLTFNNAATDGLYSPPSGIGLTLGGVTKVIFNTTRVEFDAGDLATIQIPTKTDTGDPSSPVNGDLYVNLQDNRVRVFADAAWRDLATW